MYLLSRLNVMVSLLRTAQQLRLPDSFLQNRSNFSKISNKVRFGFAGVSVEQCETHET